VSAPRRGLVARLAGTPRAGTLALLAPGLAWLVALVLAPLALVAAYSVLSRGAFGGVVVEPTLAAWRRLGDPLYLAIAARTVLLAALTTLLCLVLAYPLAWTIAQAGRWRRLLLLLVVLPFWTSGLVRTYALIFLLRDTGLVNEVLRALGLVEAPLRLLHTEGAVLAGLVYGALPFMVLPLYASLEKLDPALLEAAEVLGASPWARFRRVILPLSRAGAAAGAVLVFVPTLGAFLVPDLLGGGRQMMLGTLVQNQFGPARDWPFGAAVSMATTLLVLAVVVPWLARARTGDA